jgi:hypothetical protein
MPYRNDAVEQSRNHIFGIFVATQELKTLRNAELPSPHELQKK